MELGQETKVHNSPRVTCFVISRRNRNACCAHFRGSSIAAPKSHVLFRSATPHNLGTLLRSDQLIAEFRFPEPRALETPVTCTCIRPPRSVVATLRT